MERLIDQTVEYTRERKVFGRPLLDNQVIHFKLAEFRTEVELVRSLCYRACEEYLDGTDVTMLASMAKLKAGRMLRLVTDGCLQYWGGAGYLWESPTARAFRDSRLASIGGGADEVMLQIISKLMGTLPRLENRDARTLSSRAQRGPWQWQGPRYARDDTVGCASCAIGSSNG